MVRIIQEKPSTEPGTNDRPLYQCEECEFRYKDRAWAEKCEAWCRKHKSCNIDIIAHTEENKSR